MSRHIYSAFTSIGLVSIYMSYTTHSSYKVGRFADTYYIRRTLEGQNKHWLGVV